MRDQMTMMQKQYADLVALCMKEPEHDPRVFNNPLPNDAVMTYQYGARSYVVDCYPGYTWRNGHWYKITNSLRFTQLPIREIQKIWSPNSRGYHPHSVELEKKYIDLTFQLTDLAHPVIYHGTRIFVTESYKKAKDSYIYIPSSQGAIYAHNSSGNPTVESLIKQSGIILEDPEMYRKIHVDEK